MFLTREKGPSPARVKHVPDASISIKQERVLSPEIFVKEEAAPSISFSNNQHPGYRTLTENGTEILELLSSDEEMEIDIPVQTEDTGMSSDTVVGDLDMDSDGDDYDENVSLSGSISVNDKMSDKTDSSSSDSDSDSDMEEPSSTVWLDPTVSSTVKHGHVQLTRQRSVEHVEYLSCLPSYWPVPRDKTAYIVDLSDAKYNIKDKNGNITTVDALIKNAVHYWVSLEDLTCY